MAVAFFIATRKLFDYTQTKRPQIIFQMSILEARARNLFLYSQEY